MRHGLNRARAQSSGVRCISEAVCQLLQRGSDALRWVVPSSAASNEPFGRCNA